MMRPLNDFSRTRAAAAGVWLVEIFVFNAFRRVDFLVSYDFIGNWRYIEKSFVSCFVLLLPNGFPPEISA
jgi:hypothetical protein